MLTPTPLDAAAAPALDALAELGGIAIAPAHAPAGRRPDALVISASGLTVVTALQLPAGQLGVSTAGSWTVDGQQIELGAALEGLHAAAAVSSTRLLTSGLSLPTPVTVLVLPDHTALPGAGASLLDVGGTVVVAARDAAAVVTGRLEDALVEFNTARAVYPRDVACLDADTVPVLLQALGAEDLPMPDRTALLGEGLGGGVGVVRDDGHAAADLAAALAHARPDIDVLLDTTDGLRALHREALAARVLARSAPLAAGAAELVELVFADEDLDGVGIGAFVALDGRVLFVPTDPTQPLLAAWCGSDGQPLGVYPAAVTALTVAGAAAQVATTVTDVHQAPRVRPAGLQDRVAAADRLSVAANAAFDELLGVRPADRDRAVKHGSEGGQLVWAEAALQLGPVRLAYIEYYGTVAGLPSPKAVRFELVGRDRGKPTITRIGNRDALIGALRQTRPAADLTDVPTLAAEVGKVRRGLLRR